MNAPLVPLAHVLWETGGPDLPCPWCRSQTGEEDTACPRCGHHFG